MKLHETCLPFGANTCLESEESFHFAFKMFIPECGTLHVQLLKGSSVAQMNS